MRTQGFRGYEVVAKRDVTERELTPAGWTPSFPLSPDGDPTRYRDWMKNPFCSWVVLQRRADVPASHGPHRFSRGLGFALSMIPILALVIGALAGIICASAA